MTLCPMVTSTKLDFFDSFISSGLNPPSDPISKSQVSLSGNSANLVLPSGVKISFRLDCADSSHCAIAIGCCTKGGVKRPLCSAALTAILRQWSIFLSALSACLNLTSLYWVYSGVIETTPSSVDF